MKCIAGILPAGMRVGAEPVGETFRLVADEASQAFHGRLHLLSGSNDKLQRRVNSRAVADRPADTGPFEELAMPLFARLYNFAHWLTQDRAAAEDLVQETYMKALRGFSSFQQGTNFRAWMYKILRNTFLTTQAGLKASVSLDTDDDQIPEPPWPKLQSRFCWPVQGKRPFGAPWKSCP